MMADAWDLDIPTESGNGDEIAELNITDDEIRGLCEKRLQDVMTLHSALGTLDRSPLADALAALNDATGRIGSY
jgi:hypothetical protein